MAALAMPTMSVYTHIHTVLSVFRDRDQFKGSSGSEEGAGTSTISLAPSSACFELFIVPRRSTKWTVPGMGGRSSSCKDSFGALIFSSKLEA